MVFVFCFIQVQSLTLSKNVLSAFLKLGTLVLDDIELTIVMSKFYHKVDFFPVNAFFMVLGFLFFVNSTILLCVCWSLSATSQ